MNGLPVTNVCCCFWCLVLCHHGVQAPAVWGKILWPVDARSVTLFVALICSMTSGPQVSDPLCGFNLFHDQCRTNVWLQELGLPWLTAGTVWMLCVDNGKITYMCDDFQVMPVLKKKKKSVNKNKVKRKGKRIKYGCLCFKILTWQMRKERFLIRWNRTKLANFRCNHLFQATYNTTENS